ncbi:hypothetical protein R3P38DRAFT_3351413 [Favolaschia claudopus]|uniref:Uncharacterized protein n=1 Tax=Favolaschia claudopus TaxID=2862362 RepID=A0AAW0C691_9AGAR
MSVSDRNRCFKLGLINYQIWLIFTDMELTRPITHPMSTPRSFKCDNIRSVQVQVTYKLDLPSAGKVMSSQVKLSKLHLPARRMIYRFALTIISSKMFSPPKVQILARQTFPSAMILHPGQTVFSVQITGAETINPKQRLRQGDIDPQLLPPPRGSAKRANPPAGDKPDAPPNKKSRTSHGQQYRKILNEDPLETAKESINAVLLSGFSIPWAELGATVQAAKPSHPVTAKKFASLLDGAIGLIDHRWLVHAGLMAEKKRPAKDKGSAKIFVYVDGKKREMTDTMMIDARNNTSMWPECVEQGMDAVTQVLKNRSGRSKCITCQSAQRGIKLENRPIPHRADHPYLEGCKCPIRGAALELWMIKVTAEITGIPQRGDDDIRKRRLALNPDILKVIAAAIKAASGHEVETLLQPEFERLIHTVIWGLDTLRVIAENEDSKYSKSFDLLLKKFNETIEVWKKESEDSDSDSSSSSSSDSD